MTIALKEALDDLAGICQRVAETGEEAVITENGDQLARWDGLRWENWD